MFDTGPAAPGIVLCSSADLVDGGLAVSFDVRYGGQTCTAFAIRFRGEVSAFLNRCTHVAVQMDYRSDRFFDDTGSWLLCYFHGAAYDPRSGACVGGPCRGGLVKIEMSEQDGVVRWHTAYNLQPAEF